MGTINSVILDTFREIPIVNIFRPDLRNWTEFKMIQLGVCLLHIDVVTAAGCTSCNPPFSMRVQRGSGSRVLLYSTFTPHAKQTLQSEIVENKSDKC
jgi:hypothetical protein